MESLNLKSVRATKARLSLKIGNAGYWTLVIATIVLTGLGVFSFFYSYPRIGYLAVGLALISLMLASWYNLDLRALDIEGNSLDGRLSLSILGRLKPGKTLTPLNVWRLISHNPQALFFSNHFLLSNQEIESCLSDNTADLNLVWSKSSEIADALKSSTIEVGYIAAALFTVSPGVKNLLEQRKLSSNDIQSITLWLNRLLDTIQAKKPYFGGIGRDWAHGFTPLLNRFGYNISLEVEHQVNGYYSWLTNSPGVTAIKNAFAQGTTAIALVGPNGIGKTSHVYALAQVLLSEENNPNLEHKQIVGLDSSTIISSTPEPGQTEQLVTSLIYETVHAGNMVIFLDNAELFFSEGVGSFDITQILLPLIQSAPVQIIMAMTPNDFQRLKNAHSAFATLITPVTLTEPDEKGVIRVLEDTALGLEFQHKVLIGYEALLESYKLSGRYDQDVAYPGRAINLLKQSLAYASDGVVTAASVQKTIEQTRGVKVSAVETTEAKQLLNLEDEIHKRMINQTRAVGVVSNALRRARAGVADPKRPIGSFLFLGPTGVGKTELAKSIAATYFGAENKMIRLDMSEYQQAKDADRLLASGNQESSTLLMSVNEQPFSVVLLDEIEKAHPNVLNLLLQMLDEGKLTDSEGRVTSFKDCIIIATSNAGANVIRERVEKGEELESFESEFVDRLISDEQFKPELINRFDEIVLFRPLNQDELAQVVGLLLVEVNKNLENQKISVELTPEAIKKVVELGYDARLGARPMRRVLQSTVEDRVANKILNGEVKPGDRLKMDAPDMQA